MQTTEQFETRLQDCISCLESQVKQRKRELQLIRQLAKRKAKLLEQLEDTEHTIEKLVTGQITILEPTTTSKPIDPNQVW